MGRSTSIHDIKTLVLSFHPVVAIDTVEEETAVREANKLGIPVEEAIYTSAKEGVGAEAVLQAVVGHL